MQIDSGAGNGASAAVDDTNRLKTRSITEDAALEASSNGEAFAVTTGAVTLTNASESAVFWYQNEDDFTVAMDRIVFSAGVSTGGTTNMCTVQSTINPDSMTSGSGTEIIDFNANLGSSKTLVTTSSEIGQQGASISGGSPGPRFFFPDKLTTEFSSKVIIPKGTGIAFSVTPPTSNTSLSVTITLNIFKVIDL